MALTQIDKELIDRCLTREPDSWKLFVDRFAGLFVHVVRHAAECRSFPLDQADLDDMTSEIMTQIVSNDFKILRNFRGKSSLATYLAVVARRIAVREMAVRAKQATIESSAEFKVVNPHFDLENRDQIEHLIRGLPENEARIIKAFHLDGKSYREISDEFSISENSIGPTLSRAKELMRRMGSPQK